MPAYRLILFDFDGTLADSADWMIRTFNAMAPQFGLRSVTEAEVEMLRGRSNREIVSYLGVPMWKVPRIAAEMTRRVAAQADSISLFEGTGAMLQTLHAAGIRLAIVSSNAEDNIRRILGADNAALISDYDCGASLFGKSSKLRNVLRRSGIAPREAICIGDETRDIEAAREAGMDSGAVLWGYAKPDVLRTFQPSRTFESMSSLAALAN
jgi:phosphoglycolate phosphatase